MYVFMGPERNYQNNFLGRLCDSLQIGFAICIYEDCLAISHASIQAEFRAICHWTSLIIPEQETLTF